MRVVRQKRCCARVPRPCAVPRAEAPPRGVFAWCGAPPNIVDRPIYYIWPRADIPRGLRSPQARGPGQGPCSPSPMAGSVHVYVSSGQLQTVKLQFNKTESSYLLFLECSPQNSCFFLCAGKIAGFVCVDAARKKKQLMFTVYFITVYPTNLKAAMSFIRIIITFNAV